MSGRAIKKGSTDQSTEIRIIDSTTGAPETAVEHNTAGIDLWYRRAGAAKVSLTEAALAALTTAHTDGGIEHIGDGYYRLDLPDAAFATGADSVLVGGAVTGMMVIGVSHPLVDYDPNDAVRLGLTALPNAAADAPGGLPISDAGGLDIDAKLAATNEVTSARMGALTDWINGGRLDLLLDAIKTVTDNLPNSGELSNLDAAISTRMATTHIAATSGKVDGVALVDVTTTNTDQRGTDGANTVTPPTVAEMNARTLVAADYGTAANQAAIASYIDAEIAAIKTVTDVLPDAGALTTINGNIAAIKAITDELASKAAIASTFLAAGDVDGYSVEESLKIQNAAAAGKLSGAATTSIGIRAVDDSKTRITATVDENGNRSAVTIDATG